MCLACVARNSHIFFFNDYFVEAKLALFSADFSFHPECYSQEAPMSQQAPTSAFSQNKRERRVGETRSGKRFFPLLSDGRLRRQSLALFSGIQAMIRTLFSRLLYMFLFPVR